MTARKQNRGHGGCERDSLLIARMLAGKVDRFDGITVSEFPDSIDVFLGELEASLATWVKEGKTGVWLKLPVSKAAYVTPAVEDFSFEIHHAQKEYIMLKKWLGKDNVPDLIPGYAHMFIGIGGLVINSKGEILCVAERFTSNPNRIEYKLPGGHVDANESLAAAVEREVFEETGMRVQFQSISSMRHLKTLRYGCGDLYFCAVCKPLDENAPIQIDPNEILECRWIHVDKFLSEAYTSTHNKVMVEIALKGMNGDATESVAHFVPDPVTSSEWLKRCGAWLYHGGPHRNCNSIDTPLPTLKRPEEGTRPSAATSVPGDVLEGGCHCGKVRYQCRLDLSAGLSVWKCNCSICVKKQNHHVIVPKSQFILLSGEDSLATYRFNTKIAAHTFCKVCGVQSFYSPRSNPDGIGVVFHCLDQFETLQESANIQFFDGQNWEDYYAGEGAKIKALSAI